MINFLWRADPGPALTICQVEVPIPHARLSVGRVAGWPFSGFHCVQNLRTINAITMHVVHMGSSYFFLAIVVNLCVVEFP